MTPGQTTKKVQEEALGGALQLTVNANSVTGVLASIATSLLNTIVQAGVTAAVQHGTAGLTAIALGSGSSSNGGVAPVQPNAPTGGPAAPATQCYPKQPACSSGPGGQCATDYFGSAVTFSATGGDGYQYTWSVNPPAGVLADQLSGDGPTFSPIFTLDSSAVDPVTGVSTVSLPVTIPVTVTGSDGKSDTCLAVIAQ